MSMEGKRKVNEKERERESTKKKENCWAYMLLDGAGG